MKNKKVRGYETRIVSASMLLKEKHGAGLYQPMVAHDNWCKSYKGKPCNCFPDITVQVEDIKYTIDFDGELIQTK